MSPKAATGTKEGLAIAMQAPNVSGYVFKFFTCFQEFARWYLRDSGILSEDDSLEGLAPDSCDYEVIEGHQRLYFDFDGELNVEDLSAAICVQHQRLEQRLGRQLPIAIDLYSSSDSVKKSYHVIVRGFCFPDHLLCRRFACEIIEIAGTSVGAFDATVYTSKRNLRLLHSRKINSTRIKTFVRTVFTNQVIERRSWNQQTILLESLVSYVRGCVLIPVGDRPLPAVPESRATMSADTVRDALSLVNDLLPGVFSFRELRGKTLFLKRNRAALCPVCERVHDNDNAMVVLRRPWNGNQEVLFFICMRDTSRSMPLQSDEEIELPTALSASTNVVTHSDVELFAMKIVRAYPFAT